MTIGFAFIQQTAGLEPGPLDNKTNGLVQDQPVSSYTKKGAEYLKSV